MYYIYKYTNKINNKSYVGQTNNIQKRKNGHRSAAYNQQDHSYTDAFHTALRKYGENNFDFEILEEIDEQFGREYLNEREQFFIEFFQTHVSQKGYNITWGGDGCNKPPKTFQECCACSKILTEEQIRDIQQMLIDGYQYFELKQKYPILTDSFCSNINNGWNFKREDLNYPLKTLHTKFSKQTMNAIKQDIRNNIPYKIISERYGISQGYISEINSGHRWFDVNEFYPLCKKNCSDKQWGINCIKDILFTNLTYEQIGQKYQKSLAAVKAIATGRNFNNKQLKYSLRKYKEENKKIWNTLFE